MRPRGLSRSSPSTWYVGQVAVQKPQCTHLRRMASASRPSGVSRMKSARRVCMCRYTFCMKWVIWLLGAAAIGVLAYGLVMWRRRSEALRRASEERSAALMAEVMVAAKSRPAPPQAEANLGRAADFARAAESARAAEVTKVADFANAADL